MDRAVDESILLIAVIANKTWVNQCVPTGICREGVLLVIILRFQLHS
jgi:hypothetical protein